MRISKDKMMERYIVCDKCGYNNEKERFQAFGTCLKCKKILDKRIYFRAEMIRRSLRAGRIKGERVNMRSLPF